MDQRIFELNLSVEATSLYLLAVSLSDGGALLDRENISRFWNGTEAQFELAWAELLRRRVTEQTSEGVLSIRPFGEWLPQDES